MIKEKKKFKLSKNALILSIMTFVTILSWIFFEIYRTMVKSTIPELTQKQMTPLNPKLKTKTIQMLQNQLSLTEKELNTMAAIPTSEPTETPASTESASLEENQ